MLECRKCAVRAEAPPSEGLSVHLLHNFILEVSLHMWASKPFSWHHLCMRSSWWGRGIYWLCLQLEVTHSSWHVYRGREMGWRITHPGVASLFNIDSIKLSLFLIGVVKHVLPLSVDQWVFCGSVLHPISSLKSKVHFRRYIKRQLKRLFNHKMECWWCTSKERLWLLLCYIFTRGVTIHFNNSSHIITYGCHTIHSRARLIDY